MRENLYLIGFMGSGKSTVAKELQKKHGMELVEMDDRIAEEAGMSIPEIFETKGEAAFRSMETELLREIGRGENTVISCGGGVPMREENVRLMKESGKIVLLTAKPETILERVKNDVNRPLLKGRKNTEGIAGLMEQRRPAYEAASDFSVPVDGRSAAEIAEEILGRM
uniref:shikimate kinase n=1 Tax=Eubacterium cellulosolvens TaxID=29322 RepID=UPI000488DFCE|nr:shikimate kinase [[Eubacterium] cellulosolvens]